jgi:hypothetical protein
VLPVEFVADTLRIDEKMQCSSRGGDLHRAERGRARRIAIVIGIGC